MRYLYLISFLFLIQNSRAQDTIPKKVDVYAGIQINQLVREIINLNTTSSANDNPFLLEFSVFYNPLKTGIRGGFGFDYSSSADEDDPNLDVVKNNNLSFRIGICRKVNLSKKFELEYGLDYINFYSQIISSSSSVVGSGNNSDSSYFQNKTLKKTHGGGLAVAVRYYLSPRILLGTECSYYYYNANEKNTTEVYNHTINNGVETNSIESQNSGTNSKKFTLKLPIAIFVLFKF